MKSKDQISNSDIYIKEISTSIKALKNFKERRSRSLSYKNTDLFKYADDTFYFYRFAIERIEMNTVPLLNRILYKIMSRYNICFEVPDVQKPESCKEAPFDFIISTKFDKRIGYRFEDFDDCEDVDHLLKEYNLDNICILVTQKGKENSDEIKKNYWYRDHGKNISYITIQSFFEKYFSKNEYKEFENNINEYVSETRNIFGFKTINLMSGMNLGTRKLFEEKILLSWQYENSKYQIIDSENIKEKHKKLIYISNYDFKDSWKQIRKCYIDNKIYKALLGNESFAESFITSEWLYHSIGGEGNFDYTTIISGYLKSIEQLLKKLVMLNINNNCIIAFNKNKFKQAYKRKIVIYDMPNVDNYDGINKKTAGEDYIKCPYIDFTEELKEYMDSSLGTFEYFLRYNSKIFFDPSLSKVICDMINCFRIECRNNHFHTDNLHNWETVKSIRENSILLYALLLGSIKVTIDKKSVLGIIEEDNFDKICKEIRNLSHYRKDFVFVYEEGLKQRLTYDYTNNTQEFSNNGQEHYENLVFYEVDDRFAKILEKLNTSIKKERKWLLTRDNLPKRIYCYDINHNIHEVTPSLLCEFHSKNFANCSSN